jgi:Cys-tRNA synthase (O-phospho-L-seryl-tRNA:Cys-tRNA synthase)
LLPIFGFPHIKKKGENTKKIYIYSEEKKKKIIAVRRGYQSAQKMTKNWLRRLKIQRLKFDSIFFY